MVAESLRGVLSPGRLRPRLARSSARLAAFVLFYGVFLVGGAAVFSAIEAPDEVEIIRALRSTRARFVQRHPCVADEDLERLIEVVILAGNRGVSAALNVTAEPNWSFGQSFFFASTVITTIGYGHVHPLSEGGKIFCIMYAIVGIPMTFILLSAFVQRLLTPTTWLLHCMNSKLGHLYQPFNIRVFHLGIVGLLCFVLLMVGPALVFAKLEPGWNFLDAIYYCFISLTTIGLGDYIPGDSREQPMRPLYKICITGYLLLGLTFVLLLLHLYNDIPQLNLGAVLVRDRDQCSPRDPERIRLSNASGPPGPKYTQSESHVRQNVKVVSRPVDSPTPEEDTTPVHAQVPPQHCP